MNIIRAKVCVRLGLTKCIKPHGLVLHAYKKSYLTILFLFIMIYFRMHVISSEISYSLGDVNLII